MKLMYAGKIFELKLIFKFNVYNLEFDFYPYLKKYYLNVAYCVCIKYKQLVADCKDV
jgi:hypothetical protein